jgi:class 3 adenylate cyclase
MATQVKRKLAAILAADAVGYSRMMGANEDKTLKILSAHRAVIDGIIEFHEGRIVGTAGDSVLAEFGSPVEAVRCAVEIQDALKTRNSALPEVDRMLFRVGVNLGDVIEKDDDILGDGVNIAARLEGIAEPGGICVSSSVYEQIAGKLDLGFVDIGSQSLKNIQRPIQVYRIERGQRSAPQPPAATRSGRGAWAVGLTLAVLAAAGGGAWYLDKIPGLPSPQRAQAEAEAARKRAEAEEAQKRAQAEAEAKRVQETEAKRRAQVDAELARVRAEAESSRRKAAAELAASEEARRAAEAALKARPRPAAASPGEPKTAAALAPAVSASAPVAPRTPARPASGQRYDGKWSAELSCEPYAGRAAFTSNVELSVAADNAFNLQHGEPGQPGSFQVSGTAEPGGRLQLAGDGIVASTGRRASKPQPYKASFDGRFDAGRYEGKGYLGAQLCALKMSRAQ